MLKISRETKLNPQEVVKKAVAFFGPGGYGLRLKAEDDCTAYFEGGGGSIKVIAAARDKGSTVDIESVEWDYQAKQFFDKLK
ncbi:MAG: hypothetical protein JW845_00300 [Dehalococcoidales bacterium]|nr:hypothetical protein [Dehalococcoidales bacterium]